MRSSRRVVAGTAIVIALLTGIAVATEVSGHYQVLPFSSWSLFSRKPPGVTDDHGLRFTSLEGVAQEPPVYFEDTTLPEASSPTAYELIQDIGDHMEAGRGLRAQAAWDTFVGRYLGDVQAARVEVVARRYDVLEHRRCDCFEEETVIGELSVGP